MTGRRSGNGPPVSVADRSYGSVLCLRDPDRIQLELFWRLNHP